MMDNIREKLVELLKRDPCPSTYLCDRNCKYADLERCFEERFADHLLANGVMFQEWIPVSEPPKEWRRDNGEMINYLVYVPEFGVDIGNYGEPAKCWLCMGLPCKPTHWAPLPTPPKGERG